MRGRRGRSSPATVPIRSQLMGPLHSVVLVDLAGTKIVTLPNMPFGDWREGHLVTHENVVYVVRSIGTEPQPGGQSVVLLTVDRAQL